MGFGVRSGFGVRDSGSGLAMTHFESMHPRLDVPMQNPTPRKR